MTDALKILFYLTVRNAKKIRRVADRCRICHISDSIEDPCWVIIDKTTPDDLRTFAHLWDIVRIYKTTEFYADGKLCTREQAELVFAWIRCSCNREYFTNKSEYCYISPGVKSLHGWGCKHLFSVIRHGDFYKGKGLPWYHVGPFSGTVQYIDKQEIKDKLTAEAESKCLAICPLFSLAKVMQYVDKLPDQIDPTKDEKWEYREAIHQEDGLDVVGVQPKQRYILIF